MRRLQRVYISTLFQSNTHRPTNLAVRDELVHITLSLKVSLVQGFRLLQS
jgi:hypothetical protein